MQSLNERRQALLRELASRVQTEHNVVEHERIRLQAIGCRVLGPAVHQIRGALTGIRGFSEYLLTTDDDAAHRRELTSLIYDQAGQIAILIDELVELFDITATDSREAVSTSECLGALLRKVVERAPQTACVTLTLDESLPGANVNRAQLERALLKLLSFASDAHVPHDIDVVLRRGSEGRYIEIAVTHRVSALTSTELSRIFEPFLRTTRAGETCIEGRSLAVVKQIVDIHRGELSVSMIEHSGAVEAVLRLPG